jgi:hypothetical protein
LVGVDKLDACRPLTLAHSSQAALSLASFTVFLYLGHR